MVSEKSYGGMTNLLLNKKFGRTCWFVAIFRNSVNLNPTFPAKQDRVVSVSVITQKHCPSRNRIRIILKSDVLSLKFDIFHNFVFPIVPIILKNILNSNENSDRY